ncbi:hypothetical protein LP52_00495 [Streptomonospora alba]|uniref:Uncharacterized protein n=1 Tax=Streptomonospora alba TaxID=183763 RepID=A0A0C2JNX7_9ACTN|nr:hypothetical protein [Streptomonospora alba]KII00621.1 hypothetical protein LP52_00495 [Streptomonospora alba]
MSADELRGAATPPVAYALTDAERLALRDLLDEMVEATEDHVFWFGRAREAALEIRRRLTALLDGAEG